LKNQSEWQRTEVNGENTFIVWPALGSRTSEDQNRTAREEYIHVGVKFSLLKIHRRYKGRKKTLS